MYNRELATAILKRLDYLFPQPTSSHDLQQFQVKGFESETGQNWLEAIDALIKLRLVTGTILQNGQIFESAANLTITPEGQAELAKGGPLVPKPKSKIVFLSHAAKDQEIALQLKQLIEKAVPGSNVFVSSDTEDIRPGEEWVRKILDTLEVAGILLILATGRSVQRPWVWFETGAGWRSRLQIVPCCLGGTRKSALPAPFSQYQGLNVDDDRDLRALFREISRALELPAQEVDTQSVITECQRLDRLAGVVGNPILNADEIQRRLDLTNVSAKIDQGTIDFIVVLTNESDEKIKVTEVRLLSEQGVRLTEPHLLTERNTIEPRKRLSVDWRTQPNPADKLVSLQSAKADFIRGIPNQFETEMEVSVTFEILGKVKQSKTRLYVQVNSMNHRIDQIAG